MTVQTGTDIWMKRLVNITEKLICLLSFSQLNMESAEVVNSYTQFWDPTDLQRAKFCIEFIVLKTGEPCDSLRLLGAAGQQSRQELGSDR